MRRLLIILAIIILLPNLSCDKKSPTAPKEREGSPKFQELPDEWKAAMRTINEPLTKYQDIGYADVSNLNLLNDYETLKTVHFSSFTKWPPYAKLPNQFDPKDALNWGKIPGLNVQSLHDQGYDGSDINIAIIDHKLLLDHTEYKNQIVGYKEFPTMYGYPEMHASAVASLLVGKECGVLPKANLYYYGVEVIDINMDKYNYKYFSQALEDIIQLNSTTLADNPIRVVSVSFGLDESGLNLDMWKASLTNAEETGILVFHCSFEWLKDRYAIAGAGCKPYEDVNEINNYGTFYADYVGYQYSSSEKFLFVPGDNRTTANFILDGCYTFNSWGGGSWPIPFVSGVVALGRQINPNLSNDEIVKLLYENGTDFKVGKLINPEAFINKIKNNSL